MIRQFLPIPHFRQLGGFDYLHNRLWPIGLVVGTILVSISLAYVLVGISPALAILGVLAIPVGILLVVRPDLGLLLVVFVIPLEDFNDLGGGSVSALKLVSIVVFGGAIIHFLIFRRRDSLVGAPQNWLVFFLLLAAILSIFVSISPSRTISSVQKFMRLLALYLIVINILRSEKDLKLLVWVFIIAGFLSALYGLLNPEQASNGRFSGTMENPNAFALVMNPRLPLALCLVKLEKSTLKRIFLLVMIGVLAYGIVLAGSRGGLLSAGLGLFLFAFLQKNRIAWLFLVGLIVVAGLTVMPEDMKKRVGLVEATVDEHLGNDTTRRESYQVFGLQLWQQHPILGIGWGGFNEAYSQSPEYRFLQTDQKTRAAHNSYLEILVGMGLVGFIPFISLVGLSLFMAWKYAGYRDRYPVLGNISVGLLAGQASYFLGILFLSKEFDKTLWLLIALVVVLHTLIKAAERQRLSPTTNHNPQQTTGANMSPQTIPYHLST